MRLKATTGIKIYIIKVLHNTGKTCRIARWHERDSRRGSWPRRNATLESRALYLVYRKVAEFSERDARYVPSIIHQRDPRSVLSVFDISASNRKLLDKRKKQVRNIPGVIYVTIFKALPSPLFFEQKVSGWKLF